MVYRITFFGHSQDLKYYIHETFKYYVNIFGQFSHQHTSIHGWHLEYTKNKSNVGGPSSCNWSDPPSNFILCTIAISYCRVINWGYREWFTFVLNKAMQSTLIVVSHVPENCHLNWLTFQIMTRPNIVCAVLWIHWLCSQHTGSLVPRPLVKETTTRPGIHCLRT